MTTAVYIDKDTVKLALVSTMIALLDVAGHRKIRSRIPGCPVAPPVIDGTQSRERPDIFSETVGVRPILVEAVSSQDMKDLNALKTRLQLFYTGAESKKWDFYLCCYKTLAPHLKLFCSRNAIRYSKLWEI